MIDVERVLAIAHRAVIIDLHEIVIVTIGAGIAGIATGRVHQSTEVADVVVNRLDEAVNLAGVGEVGGDHHDTVAVPLQLP